MKIRSAKASALVAAATVALALAAPRAHAEAPIVRQTDAFTWEIDPAAIAAATVRATPELLERLVPALAEAYARHALGYDRLRAAVCAHDESMSSNRARACATLPVQAEDEWRRTGVRPWVNRGAMTMVYGGTIALTYAARDEEVSRGFATGAGVLAGYVAGVAAVYLGGKAADYPVDHPDVGFEALMLAGAVTGGLLGGLAAHALTAPPGARAPVTAVGLAPLFIIAFEATFE
ncbi:MAG TPA: hypothetical protein VKZ18_08205 [Polyangia bacterium]|nr:hypothetical protein [Polyangia bacterium]